MQKLISEILKEVSEAKQKDEKIYLLRKHDCPALREVVRYAIGEPEFYTNTLPQYKVDPAPHGLSFSTLFSEYKRLYIFLKGTKCTEKRKNELLAQMLESIHTSEADLLAKIITKQYKPNLNKKVVNEAFPGLLA